MKEEKILECNIILNLSEEILKCKSYEEVKERLVSLIKSEIKKAQNELLEELKRKIIKGKYDLKDLLFWIQSKKNFKELKNNLNK